jgi:hypothetical protein
MSSSFQVLLKKVLTPTKWAIEGFLKMDGAAEIGYCLTAMAEISIFASPMSPEACFFDDALDGRDGSLGLELNGSAGDLAAIIWALLACDVERVACDEAIGERQLRIEVDGLVLSVNGEGRGQK